MTETPRMVIVPAEATFQMTGAGKQMLAQETAVHPHAGPIAWRNIYRVMYVASPNAGRISRRQIREKVSQIRGMVEFDHLELAYDDACAFCEAFAAALGLEIAEDGEND